MASLKIRTHVGRDILQSAQSFKTPEAAIWEYVVNSLQYVQPGVVAQVSVTLDPRAKTVTILDNGEGMDRDGLGHFFTMHGENRERRRGVPGRGKFGTGKSAAFGIGTALRVETVRDEVRQRVYVDRAMIEAADGDAVDVKFEACDEPAPGVANGTVITISGVTVTISREPVVSLIERHLTAFRASSPVVNVNGRPCQVPRLAAATTCDFTPRRAGWPTCSATYT
jgi:Histidine kinase-, DNA gyrase B-, and HSP90-like ATPase